MATPSKYVKLELHGAGAKQYSLAGYRVIGDYVEEGTWHITLERPEQAAAPKRKRVVKPQVTQTVEPVKTGVVG